MLKFGALHPGEEQLLQFADGELRSKEAAAIRAHLEACWSCRTQFQELTREIGDYMHYHEGGLKPSLPAPPRPWDDIRVRMRRIDQARPSAPRRAPRRWLAAAAVLLLACLAAYRFGRPPVASAAELLRKAVAADASAPRERRQIRVRTRTHSFTRAASHSSQTTAAAEPLETLFASARFNWQDPLSARSYAAWRDQLADKRDEVEPLPAPGMYRIRTTTAHSPLTEATITLRGQDLSPVSETFQFGGNEWVEITEIQGEPVLPSPAAPLIAEARAPEAALEPAPHLETSATATQELQVIAALHGIGADLGEPIELTRSGRKLVVTGTGMEPERQEQVRSSLARVPGVAVRFDDPRPLDPEAGASKTAMSVAAARVPLQAELEKAVGGRVAFEKFANRVLELSEASMARAHALRNLAERFPPSAESQLGDRDKTLLATLRREHAQALSGSAGEILNSVKPALAALGEGSERAPAETALGPDWQAGAVQVFVSAQQVDQLLNVLLAGADSRLAPAEIPSRLASASARFRALAAAYRDSLKEGAR